MKNKIAFFAAISFAALVSCSPKITTNIKNSYPTISYKDDIVVIEMDEKLSNTYKVIGDVKVGDSGFTTKCDYEIVIDMAKNEARAAGGNALKIIEHNPPSLASSCHRIKAEILFVENIQDLVKEKEQEEILDIDYAILYVYRPSGAGMLVNYDIHLGDTVICRIGNNEKKKIRIYKDGLNTIWAKTETKTELPIKVELGKEYYLRCGVGMGIMVGRPILNIVNKSTGKAAYRAIKKSSDVIIRTNGTRLECEILKETDNDVFLKTMVRGEMLETRIGKDQIEEIEYAE